MSSAVEVAVIGLGPTGAILSALLGRSGINTVVIDKAGVLRYWGQFGGEANPAAENALRAVLDGKDVPVKETIASG